MGPPAPTVLVLAQRLADEVLFARAADTDAADLVPAAQLDSLAAAGLYGMAGPPAASGLGLDSTTAAGVVEALASGCLTTTFVWLQHQSVVRAVAAGPPGLRTRWLEPLCRGECRAGIAIAGIRPGVAPLRARRTDSGWILVGSVPWVTGWGRISVLHTAALDDDGNVVWLLVDAVDATSLRTDRQHLMAVDASGTVTLTFAAHPVPEDRLTGQQSYPQWQAQDAAGLRTNGSLALGVTRRCTSLLDPPQRGALGAQLDVARAQLAGADIAALPGARAAAAELAWRAATALVVAQGSRAVLAGEHGGRLAREALFLLVFGSRPAIKQELLSRLAPD